jgi:HK97 gp10 family phage protein
MPPVLTIKATGLDKAIKDLNALSTSGLQEALVGALELSSQLTLRRLQENTPVDTGNLRASESAEVNTQNLTALIGPDLNQAYYAPFVEFGYTHYLSGKFIPGQHFIQKTGLEVASSITEIFRQAIQLKLTKQIGY